MGLHSLFGQVSNPRSTWVLARPRCALSAFLTARSRALALVLARAASARFACAPRSHLLYEVKRSSNERFFVRFEQEELGDVGCALVQ
jgi:hypothetical protein